jgi:formylmethanofuran dehydrogenase subunit E
MLQLAAVGFFVLLGYTVVNEFVWKGQHSARTLDFGKAILTVKDRGQRAVRREAATMFLKEKILKALKEIKELERSGPSEIQNTVRHALGVVAGEVEGYR